MEQVEARQIKMEDEIVIGDNRKVVFWISRDTPNSCTFMFTDNTEYSTEYSSLIERLPAVYEDRTCQACTAMFNVRNHSTQIYCDKCCQEMEEDEREYEPTEYDIIASYCGHNYLDRPLY